MDTEPLRPDDVNDLEQRLAGWRPSATGLDAERMLFAAGRASARPGRTRFIWPGAAGGMTLLAILFAVLFAHERAGRLSLEQFVRHAPAGSAVVNAYPPAPSPESAAAGAFEPDSYLVARRVLEQDPDAWAARVVARADLHPGPALPDVPILSVRSRGGLLDP